MPRRLPKLAPGQALHRHPDGSDWKNWTLASCQVGGKTDLVRWNKTTGALYLWTNLAHPDQYTLTYTQNTIASSGWNTGASITLQVADVNGDGTPDLFTVGAGGTVKTYLVTCHQRLRPSRSRPC